MLQSILLQWWRPQTERGAGLRSGERSRNQSVPPPFPYSPDSVLCVVCSMLSVVCWVLCSVLTFDRVPCQPFKVSCFLSPGRGQGWCVVGICFIVLELILLPKIRSTPASPGLLVSATLQCKMTADTVRQLRDARPRYLPPAGHPLTLW